MKFIAAADRLYLLDGRGGLWLFSPRHQTWEEIRVPDDAALVVDAAVTVQRDYEVDEVTGARDYSNEFFVYIRTHTGQAFQADRYGRWSPLPLPEPR